jgi:hypothetical protein
VYIYCKKENNSDLISSAASEEPRTAISKSSYEPNIAAYADNLALEEESYAVVPDGRHIGGNTDDTDILQTRWVLLDSLLDFAVDVTSPPTLSGITCCNNFVLGTEFHTQLPTRKEIALVASPRKKANNNYAGKSWSAVVVARQAVLMTRAVQE